MTVGESMASLDGRVVIVTGAGRGIGREHALFFAQEGAHVIVNDHGGANDGSGGDTTPAEEVAAEVRALGGQAVANTDDVSSWSGAEQMVATQSKSSAIWMLLLTTLESCVTARWPT
jgi:NAD(P)-dependent dehydrogenase (short-subunit alcohol dehydrogenase family)